MIELSGGFSHMTSAFSPKNTLKPAWTFRSPGQPGQQNRPGWGFIMISNSSTICQTNEHFAE